MTEPTEEQIAAEAFRLWQAEGSPVWGHPQDHWFRAIERLRARGASLEQTAEIAATTQQGDGPHVHEL